MNKHNRGFFEIRVYKTGWVARVGNLCLRYNNQEHYAEITIEWIKKVEFQHVGGRRVI